MDLDASHDQERSRTIARPNETSSTSPSFTEQSKPADQVTGMVTAHPIWRQLQEVNPDLFEHLRNTQIHISKIIPDSVRHLWESSAGTVPELVPSSKVYLSDERYTDRERWTLFTSSGGKSGPWPMSVLKLSPKYRWTSI